MVRLLYVFPTPKQLFQIISSLSWRRANASQKFTLQRIREEETNPIPVTLLTAKMASQEPIRDRIMARALKSFDVALLYLEAVADREEQRSQVAAAKEIAQINLRLEKCRGKPGRHHFQAQLCWVGVACVVCILCGQM